MIVFNNKDSRRYTVEEIDNVLQYSWERHIRSINITCTGLGAINVITGYYSFLNPKGHDVLGLNIRSGLLK